MVRNKLAAVVAAFGALQADVAGALGLGEFTLNSALNQPLDAEIRLLDTADLDKTQIIIKLASAKDFDNAGVIRDFFLTNLRFDVELDGSGAGVIRVTSREPVLEPYLDIMMEARWPSGRLLREYTVLLDLPVFSDSQAEAVTAPSTQQVVPDVKVEAMPAAPVPTSASVPVLTEDRKTLTEGATKAGETYRVRRDDTLWEIAMKARPTKKLSVQQTMVGIQRNNPQAFIKGNINRLKAGSVLRLPTEQEVRTAVSRNQAVSEVAQHNRQWKSGAPEQVPTEAPLQAKASPAAVSRSVSEEPRLSIAAAADDETASFGEGGQAAEGEGVGALQNELTQSQESLDKAKLDNEEMSQRLGNMEEKLATMQRLLELKDEQLASLQGSAAKSGEQPATAPTKPVDKAAEKPEPAKAPVDPAVAEQDIVSMLLANPTYLGGGAALLILLLLLALRKGKGSEEDEAEQLEAVDQPAEELADVAIDESTAEIDEESVEAVEDVVEAESFDVVEPEDLEQAPVEAEASAAPVTSQTGDAVAEADIYIAYGRYQQAVDLLNAAIEQNPSSELYLKLLEVCVESRDKDSFLSAYGALQASGDEQAVAEAKELLSTSDEVASWLDNIADQSLEAPVESLEESVFEEPASEPLDLDTSLEDELSAELDEALGDLDLGDSDTDEGLSLELEAEPAAEEELSLDFEELANLDESAIEEPSADLELDLSEDESLELDEQPGLDEEFSALEEPAETLDLSEGEGLNLVDEQPGLDEEFTAEVELGEDLEELSTEPEVTADDGLDLDLDGDLDLDLDLDADLDSLAGAADLDDLAAEFDQPSAEPAEEFEEPEENVIIPAAEEAPAGQAGDDDMDLMADADEVATKLDLARAYMDMGDSEGANEILDEVISEGNDEQQQEAKELLEKL